MGLQTTLIAKVSAGYSKLVYTETGIFEQKSQIQVKTGMNMNTNDQEMLSQYLDNELNAVESQQLEQKLAKSPALRLELDNMRAMDKTLKSKYHTVQARTVPARILDMLRKPVSQPSTENQVIPFPNRQRTARWSFAIAASVMAASGLLLMQGTGQQLAEQSPGADSVLAQALESMPSHGEGWDTLSDGRKIHPVLTYARLGGSWCREYILSEGSGQNSHGIACRRGEADWVTEVSEAQPASSSSAEYRTAGAADSDKVAQYMSTTADGIALNRDKEEQLIASEWR